MKNLKNIFFILLIVTNLTACLGKVVKDVESDVQDSRQGPRELPVKNITDFSDGLRCMDNLFSVFQYQPNEFVVLLEEIKDKTEQVKAGTREMLIAAISDMTRRSQAVQVIAYGAEASNLVSFLEQAQYKGAYTQIPPFDIIGAISQMDKDIVRKQADAALQFEGTVDGTDVGSGMGKSRSNSASLLGLDLSVIGTHNMAVIPGVVSSNTVVIYRSGNAFDIDAGISKTGITFSMSGNKGDSTAQALRALIQLSAIELIGKLAKLPYWTCLGLDPEHDEIRSEISDWYYHLSQSNIIHQVTQSQLYLRGYYNGPVDGSITQGYENAIVAYKKRLGLPANPSVDLLFYEAFLNDSPNKIDIAKLPYNLGKNPPKGKQNKRQVHNTLKEGRGDANAKKSKKAKKQEKFMPEKLSLTINSNKSSYDFKEQIFLDIRSNVNGYVSCYIKNEDKIARVFPNRFSLDGYLSKSGKIVLPDSDRYSIIADKDGESIHCFLVTANVYSDLPSPLQNNNDFNHLNISSFEELDKAYKKAAFGRYTHSSFVIRVN